MLKYFAACAALVMLATGAMAGSEKQYIWYGWRMTNADYAIVHALPKDPTESDFYLVCHGGRDQVDLGIRAIKSGGYALEDESDVPTTFNFGKTKIPLKAWRRTAAEMLGGINVDYLIDRDSPVLTAIARGEPFRIALPKTTTQIFMPKAARRFFIEMAAHCKTAP